MNRGRLVLVVALFALGTRAAAADSVEITVSVSTGIRTQIEYTFGHFDSREVRVAGVPHQQITLPGESVHKLRGAPALPTVARSIIIPDDRAVQVRVIASESYVIDDIDIAPSRGILPRTIDPSRVPLERGPTYDIDAVFPAAVAELGSPYILRDHRGVAVTVHPFQYNPVRMRLRVYTSLTVEVTDSGPAVVNELKRTRARTLVRPFQELYQAHFINYATSGRYTPVDEQGDLLIIVDDLWVDEVQPLADHKNVNGIATTVLPVSAAGSTSAAIAATIQSTFDTSDLAFVLLVGDSAQVPTPTVLGGASDPSYALCAGSDNYPDLFVGRFSAETAAQVTTQVDRTIAHETIPATTQDWYWRAIGIGSDQGPGHYGELDYEHEDLIRDDLLAYGYTVVDQLYDPSATAGQVSTAIEAGRGIINYTGHGSTTSWGTTGFNNGDVNALTNVGMLPWITSVACVNGDFVGTTCFGEAWLRATSAGEPTGAVGAYMSSINQYWDPPMEAQDEIVDLLVAESFTTYGALCFNGSCAMMDAYGTSGEDMYLTWHIFGDPSLRVVGTLVPPTGLTVGPSSGLHAEGPYGGPFTPAEFTYTLTNHDATDMPFSVTADVPWVDVNPVSGVVPAGASVSVTVALATSVSTLVTGSYQGIVTIENLATHEGDTTRPVDLVVGVPVPVHTFSLDGDPGWTATGEWQFGVPAGAGGASHGEPDPAAGATGSNVYGIALGGDYSPTMGPASYLESAPIDCSDLSDVELHFQRWLNCDYQPYVIVSLEASIDGSTWTPLWENGSEFITDAAWTEQVFDLSAIADHQSTFYLRWSHQVDSFGAYAFSGWNLDDIEIWGVAPPPSGPAFDRGDCNIDGACDLADALGMLAILFDGTPVACDDACDCNDDGALNIADAVHLLFALFTGTTEVPAPHGACGPDVTGDALDCTAFGICP